MELLMLFQICLLSLLLLGVDQRAWEIILWLAFKTKQKQNWYLSPFSIKLVALVMNSGNKLLN